MGISISEALGLPVMSQTRLVAGHDGLGNIIKWVTIVEVIEDITRFQEGEFLITTGFGLRESEEKRKLFQALLSSGRLSGLAIYTGFYLEKIPDIFIEIANKYALPVLTIPTHINFSAITRAILEQIVNRQMRLYEYSLAIHQQLTRLVLGKHGIHKITETLSGLINGSVLLLNHIGDPVDSVLIHGHLVCTNGSALQIDGETFPVPKYHELLECRDLQIFHCPVIANEMNYGSIIAVKDFCTWSELDSIAIEHAATVYAIELLKQKAIEETEIRLKGDFLDEILAQHFENTAAAVERGRRFGYDLTVNQAVYQLTFAHTHSNEEADDELIRQLYNVIGHILQKIQRQYIIRNRRDKIILLAEVMETTAGTKRNASVCLAEDIQTHWLEAFPEHPLQIGIGRSYTDVTRLSQSAQEARYAMTFAPLLTGSRSIVHYDDLGPYHFLIQMKELGADLTELYAPVLGPLLTGKQPKTDLLRTLETYLQHNQSIHATASELFIHRHTLKYRLGQIEKKIGLTLDLADDRMKAQLAIMAYKLLHLTG